MYILGITGKIKSGKDTVYEMIKEELSPWKVERVAFADHLKYEVARACGTTIEYINEHKDNFRLILQGWGTDYKRKLIRDDYWVSEWCKRVNYISDNTHLVIATDVRFLNEAKMITDLGGKIIRVIRHNITDNPWTPGANHASETEQDKIKQDFLIDNKFDLITLREVVKSVLGEIKQSYMNGYKYTNSKDGTKAGVIHTS